MRAEVMGRSACFEVEPGEDGKPPSTVTLTLRPCWKKPPVKLEVAYLYTHGQTAYYVEVR